jgi:hypothetical protein
MIGVGRPGRARAARLRQKDPGALFRALGENPRGLSFRSMASHGAGEGFSPVRRPGAEIGSGSGHATAVGIALPFGLPVKTGGLSAPRRRATKTDLACCGGDDLALGPPRRPSEGFGLPHPPGIGFGPFDPAGGRGAGMAALPMPGSGLPLAM